MVALRHSNVISDLMRPLPVEIENLSLVTTEKHVYNL
jgi:hypothetical protein